MSRRRAERSQALPRQIATGALGNFTVRRGLDLPRLSDEPVTGQGVNGFSDRFIRDDPPRASTAQAPGDPAAVAPSRRPRSIACAPGTDRSLLAGWGKSSRRPHPAGTRRLCLAVTLVIYDHRQPPVRFRSNLHEN